jgi:hypothetical protein
MGPRAILTLEQVCDYAVASRLAPESLQQPTRGLCSHMALCFL